MWAGLLCQLCIGLLQLEGPEILDVLFQEPFLSSVQQASPSTRLLLSSLHRERGNYTSLRARDQRVDMATSPNSPCYWQ